MGGDLADKKNGVPMSRIDGCGHGSELKGSDPLVQDWRLWGEREKLVQGVIADGQGEATSRKTMGRSLRDRPIVEGIRYWIELAKPPRVTSARMVSPTFLFPFRRFVP